MCKSWWSGMCKIIAGIIHHCGSMTTKPFFLLYILFHTLFLVCSLSQVYRPPQDIVRFFPSTHFIAHELPQCCYSNCFSRFTWPALVSPTTHSWICMYFTHICPTGSWHFTSLSQRAPQCQYKEKRLKKQCTERKISSAHVYKSDLVLKLLVI